MKRIVCTLFCCIGLAEIVWAEDLNLPDPLIANDGTEITSKEQWMEFRRAEVLELFRANVFGRRPEGTMNPVAGQYDISSGLQNLQKTIKTTKGVMDGEANLNEVRWTYDALNGVGEMNMVLFTPAGVEKPESIPCFLLISHRTEENIDPTRETKVPFWPAEEIIARGYATAAFWVGYVDPDDRKDDYQNGIQYLFEDQSKERPDDAWAALAAWAWGASLCMDHLVDDKMIASDKVAVLGHSRGGKTALWAGAEDPRFSLVISNESGNSGAALSRRSFGESVKRINDVFPNWFNKNYKKYNDNVENLPIDQHMLMTLIAPRLLYVASAAGDQWADPEGEFLSAKYARPVYELFGHSGLGDASFPKNDSPIHGDRMAYHIRTGKHNLLEYDWHRFMDFADKHWADKEHIK